MSAPRPELVSEMVDAMIEALRVSGEESTGDEVFSAAMTFACHTARTMIRLGAKPELIRYHIERLMIECVPEVNNTLQ